MVSPLDAEATAWLVNGAALNAALWVAASDDPRDVLGKAVQAFRCIADGLLRRQEGSRGMETALLRGSG